MIAQASMARRWAATGIRLPFPLAVFLVALGARVADFLLFYVGSILLGYNGRVDLYDSVAIDSLAWWTAQQLHQGHWVWLARFDLAGTWEVGYDYFVAFQYFLFGHWPEIPRLVQCALAAFTAPAVYWTARGTVLGETVARRAAWLVALWPLSIYWAGYDLLKDPMIWFLIALGMLAIGARARGSLALLSSLPAVAFFFVRFYLGIAFALLLPAWLLLRREWAALAAAVAILLASQVVFAEVHFPSLLSPLAPYAGNGVAVTENGSTLPGPASSSRYNGRGSLVGTVNGQSGQNGGTTATIQGAGTNSISILQLGPLRIVVRTAVGAIITVLGPRPALHDILHPTLDSGMYPGLLVWLLMIPFTALGLWRGLRTRNLLVYELLSLAVGLWVGISFIYGGAFRQREMAFPPTLIFTALGLQAPLPRRWWWFYGGVMAAGTLVLLLREARVI